MEEEKSRRNVIKNGDVIIIQRHNYMRTHTFNTKKPVVQLGRDYVNVSIVEGLEFGTSFKMVASTKVKKQFDLEIVPEIVVNLEDQFIKDDSASGKDNRNITDENVSQKLTREEIETMRENGKTGTEIIERLIENSDTFTNKTKFSQAKFLKKKARKYFEYLTIRKPTVRLLMQIYYKADPMKIMNLRIDTLAQLLNMSDLKSGGRFLVYEAGCQGIVVAAALERIGKSGKLIHIYQTGNPQTQSLNAMNFDESVTSNLHTLNMYHLRTLESEEKDELTVRHGENGEDEQLPPARQVSREKSIEAYELMKGRDMDGLIIACRQHPTNLLLTLTEYLAPSRAFAVFSPYKEPLLDAYLAIKDKGRAVMVTLSETWFRNYQVLPDRSHPEVLMSGGGGYLLTGIVVTSDNNEETPTCSNVKRLKTSDE